MFRPVGQVALANALGNPIFRKKLSEIYFRQTRRFDVDEDLATWTILSLLDGILYDPNKKRVLVSEGFSNEVNCIFGRGNSGRYGASSLRKR